MSDQVLLCLSTGAGKWNVPEGHVMKGEDPAKSVELENLKK